PESTTFLRYKREFTSFNKYTAMSELLVQLNLDIAVYFELFIESHPNLITYIEGKYHEDLMYTPVELSELASSGLIHIGRGMTKYQINFWKNNIEVAKLMRPIPRYIGKQLGLYAVEDILDQKLCKLAKTLDYDVVILTNMIGSHQIVTEVLDVRDRVT
ncbi:unnamed protein product, partial [marine sediment metagenome]